MILPYSVDKFVKKVLFIGHAQRVAMTKKFLQDVKIAREEKGKCIFIFNSPTHGNLGDHAIAVAQRQILEKYVDKYHIVEITTELCFEISDVVKRNIQNDDVLIISGGGFIGTLWWLEQMSVLNALEFGKNNPLIILPQTVFFSKDDYGAKALAKFKTRINQCNNIQIFLRDEKSYKFMIEQVVENKEICHLNCDLVTFIQADVIKQDKKNVLFCFRTDKEKLEHKAIDEIKNRLIELGYEINYTDTVLDRKIYTVEERNELVKEKFAQFSKYNLVVTDRLHGMLFAVVSNSPCLAFDNVSRKISGVYDATLNAVPYVVCTDGNISFDETSLDKLLELENVKYDNSPFADNYKKLMSVLDSVIK